MSTTEREPNPIFAATLCFRIAASTLRTVDHRGGLDAFLAKAKDEELSPKALKVKKDVQAALAG
jgi:large subunit ribosomal protein L28